MAPLCVKDRRIGMKLKNIISGFALSLALVSATYQVQRLHIQMSRYLGWLLSLRHLELL